MSQSKINIQIRQAVRLRAKGSCEYCLSQEKLATQSFSVEHIKSISKGGITALENLALACQGCNNHKYNKTEGQDPASGKIIPLYNPKQQNWHEHFTWNDDYAVIVGLTPTGRVTIEVLRLNREGLKNLRRILYAMGEYPSIVE